MNKTKSETFALGQYLYSWPDHLTYAQIITIMNDDNLLSEFNLLMENEDKDDQQIQACEMYELESYDSLAEMIDELRDSVSRSFEAEKPLVCEYCEKPMLTCVQHYEVTAYGDIESYSTSIIDDMTFATIDDGIAWAKTLEGANWIDVYSGCNRENKILTLNLT